MTERIAALRGARLREMRETLELTQKAFMDQLNAMALSLGLDRRYDGNDISTRETGARKLDAEDYAILSHIDPARWSAEWLAFGRDLPVATKAVKVAGAASRKR